VSNPSLDKHEFISPARRVGPDGQTQWSDGADAVRRRVFTPWRYIHHSLFSPYKKRPCHTKTRCKPRNFLSGHKILSNLMTPIKFWLTHVTYCLMKHHFE
jgi:hypothetical protein